MAITGATTMKRIPERSDEMSMLRDYWNQELAERRKDSKQRRALTRWAALAVLTWIVHNAGGTASLADLIRSLLTS